MTGLPVRTPWFEIEDLGNGIRRMVEPGAHRLMRANMFLIAGSERDCLFDTGLGVADLAALVESLTDKPLVVVASHAHLDHIGGHNQFAGADILVHASEAAGLATPDPAESLSFAQFGPRVTADLANFGFATDGPLLDAIPHDSFDIAGFRCRGIAPTATIGEGDRIDLGGRVLDVLHLPGHSPGGIGLIDRASGDFWAGDALYEGTIIDTLPGSDRATYRATMRRIMTLTVTTVHGGHNRASGATGWWRSPTAIWHARSHTRQRRLNEGRYLTDSIRRFRSSPSRAPPHLVSVALNYAFDEPERCASRDRAFCHRQSGTGRNRLMAGKRQWTTYSAARTC